MRIIFYIFILLIIIYFLLSIFSQYHKNNIWEKSNDDNSSGTDMVKDPYCQIYIQKSEAIKRFIKGKVYYFCSAYCAKKFKNKI